MSTISDAIVNGNEQKVFLKFDGDVCFDNSDISATSGITINDYFCTEEDLTIGLCPCNTLTTKILNPDGAITKDIFSQFKVIFGVLTEEDDPIGEEFLSVPIYGADLNVYPTSPYLVYNGTPLADQPSQKVVGLYGQDMLGILSRYVYAIHEDGTATRYYFPQLSHSLVKDPNYTTSSFAQNKWRTWNGKALIFKQSTCITQEVTEVVDEDTFILATKEFATLSMGVFNPDIPKKVNVKSIDLMAYDNMKLLDKDATSFWASLTFPTTLGQIYRDICSACGVSRATSTFINDSVSYATRPATIEGVTFKEILQHIAEASCSIAKFNSDGWMELAWFSNATFPFDYHYSQDITEVEVQPIDKVQVKNSEDDIGTIVGTGTNCYTILNNMFLIGTQAEVTTMVTNIYDRLSAFASYYPSVNSVDCDWEIKSGSVITINSLSVPIFTQKIVWNTKAKTTIEATGNEVQSVNDLQNRQLYQVGARMTEVKIDVDGITATVSGLKSAQDATKLTFDSTGLTIKNGGFRIRNSSDNDVFYADTYGNLTMSGTFKTNAVSSGGSSWSCELSGLALQLKKGSEIKACVGITDTDNSTAITAQNFLVQRSGISTTTSTFNNALTVVGKDTAGCGLVGTFNGSHQRLCRFGIAGSDSTRGAIGVFYAGTTMGTIASDSGGGYIYLYNNSGIMQTKLGVSSEGMGIVAFRNSSNYEGKIYVAPGEANIKYSSPLYHDFVNADNSGYATIRCYSCVPLSDRKLKKDFVDIDSSKALDFVNGLKPQTFKFKNEEDGKHWGFVAQDVKELVDEMGEEFSGYLEDNDVCFLNYTELIAPLVKVVQDQEKRIKELEKNNE